MTKRTTRLPSGFEYNFRPTSYFQNIDPTTLILSSILGQERRKDVQERLAAGDTLDGQDWLTESKLDESTRQVIGSAHPAFMGGEYLPSIGGDEIEIARIVLQSTTQDVISIRASRQKRRIVYRVVDEYDNDFRLAQKWSTKPLSFRELIKFIDGTNVGTDGGSGLALSALEMNLEYDSDPESLRDFVSVQSNFYPELSSYYALATSACVDRFLVVEDECEEDAAPDAPTGPQTQCMPRQLYDLQNLPEDPVIRPMLISHGVPRHLWPQGFITMEQAKALIDAADDHCDES